MKKFILKISIIFIFLLLLFRFTIVSTLNEYEQKLENYASSSQINKLKKDVLQSIKKSNEKEKILDQDEAIILGTFLKKILKELDIRP
tara:strand:- start:114 stop:377 length:264 start_codon:yes stop_codon:yes gene_type:complete